MLEVHTISYDYTPAAWEKYSAFLEHLASQPHVRKICEIGGGSNPALSLEFIQKHQLEYTILDISPAELSKAPNGYIKLVGDITNPGPSLLGQQYDLIFSKMLAEHVEKGEAFHHHVYQLLNVGGKAFHFFPTLYSLPFLINFVLPESLSTKVLAFFFHGRSKQGKHGKFPAYYSMCRGPTKSQFKKFKTLGFHIEKYIGYFGHGYFDKIPILKQISRFTTKLLIKYPQPWLTSYAYVLLTKNA